MRRSADKVDRNMTNSFSSLETALSDARRRWGVQADDVIERDLAPRGSVSVFEDKLDDRRGIGQAVGMVPAVGLGD